MLQSIRSRIFAAQIAIVALVALCAGLVGWWLTSDAITGLRTANLRLLADQAGTEVQTAIGGAREKFRELSSREEIGIYVEKNQYAVLVKLLGEYSQQFSTVAYINFTGREELRLENGAAAPSRAWDLADPALAEAIARRDHVVIQTVPGQGQAGLRLRLLMAHFTFFDEFLGVVLAELPLADIRSRLAGISMGDGGFALAVDRRNRILLSPRGQFPEFLPLDEVKGGGLQNALLGKAPGLGRVVLAGKEYMAASTPVPDVDWSVLALLPLEEFSREGEEFKSSMLAVFLGLTLVVAWFASRFAAMIASPLAEVAAAARKVADGSLAEQVPVRGQSEAAELARSFNGMVGALRRAMEHAEEARRSAESANLAKSEFLARMSHEIRTPLNAVVGLTDLTLETSLSPVQRDYLETVKVSAQHLMEVITDILDFSKIEARKLELSPVHFDVRHCLETTLKGLNVQALAKGLDLDLDVAPEVPRHLLGDAARLRQILVNLVGNAIKFTREGGVRVGVGATPQALGVSREPSIRLLFTVEDTGTGIPPQEQHRLFEAFTQVARDTAAGMQGTGLGLAISKQLVAMMGGEIWVSSEPGKGSVFSFTADFKAGDPARVVEARRGAGEDAGPATRPLRILVVEDNPMNVKMASALLAKAGHSSSVAPDGLAAIAMLQAESFDLVLMDMEMPVLGGVEATERIRRGEAGEANRALPIIAMTAHALSEHRARCIAAGMNDFIAKPVNFQQLKAIITRVMSR
jgi:signal transduction histidine kinase/CheY-like chemotaxis protein